MAASQTVTTLTAAVAVGDTSFAVASATNIRPGMAIQIGRENVVVALTYVGATTVPINGAFNVAHASGDLVQYWPNVEPGLTGS